MPSIARNGLIVDYSDDGTGPTVVLLHSSVSSNRQWRRLIAELAPHYRCIGPNLLGYGQTSPWSVDRQQTLDDAAAVALAVCELTDGPIRLVGHSWGCAVALATAHELGPRATHLALYEPMLIGLPAGHHRHEAWHEAQGFYASVRQHGDAGDWPTPGEDLHRLLQRRRLLALVTTGAQAGGRQPASTQSPRVGRGCSAHHRGALQRHRRSGDGPARHGDTARVARDFERAGPGVPAVGAP